MTKKKVFKEIRHSELETLLWMGERKYQREWLEVYVEIQDDIDTYKCWVGVIDGIQFIYQGPFQSYVNEDHIEKFDSLFDDEGNLIEQN